MVDRLTDQAEVNPPALSKQIEDLRVKLAELLQVGNRIDELETLTGIRGFSALKASRGYTKLTTEVRGAIPNWKEKLDAYPPETVKTLSEQVPLFLQGAEAWIKTLEEYEPLLIAHQGLGVFQKLMNTVRLANAFNQIASKNQL